MVIRRFSAEAFWGSPKTEINPSWQEIRSVRFGIFEFSSPNLQLEHLRALEEWLLSVKGNLVLHVDRRLLRPYAIIRPQTHGSFSDLLSMRFFAQKTDPIS